MNPKYADIGTPDVKLTEECAELIMAIAKANRFGWDSSHPKTGVTNIARVLSEMNDVESRIKEMREWIKKEF